MPPGVLESVCAQEESGEKCVICGSPEKPAIKSRAFPDEDRNSTQCLLIPWALITRSVCHLQMFLRPRLPICFSCSSDDFYTFDSFWADSLWLVLSLWILCIGKYLWNANASPVSAGLCKCRVKAANNGMFFNRFNQRELRICHDYLEMCP